MAQQTINVGTSPNDGTGDTLRASQVKANANFTEIYNFNLQDILGVGHGLTNDRLYLGTDAGNGNTGTDVNAIGNGAGDGNTGNFVNAIGDKAGVNNTHDYCNLLGQNANATDKNQTVLSKGGLYMARISLSSLTSSQEYVLADNSGILSPIKVADDYADDTAAAAGLIRIGSLYHTSGVVKVRLT